MAGITPSTYVSVAIGAGYDAVPKGIILFHDQGVGSLPTGWSAYSTADDKFIVGAGSTYAVNDNGAGGGEVAKTSDSTGSHTGSSTFVCINDNNGKGLGAAGAHTHNVSYTYAPPYQGLELIKADQNHYALAPHIITLAEVDLTGLTNVYTDGYMMMAKAAQSTGGSNTQNGIATTSAGSHSHTGTFGSPNPDSSVRKEYDAAGSHSHTINLTFTNNLYQYALSAWKHATQFHRPQAAMIGLWESTTPPGGWYLCDGNNGTPDLRDYFIKLTGNGADGVSSGDGKVEMSSSASAAGAHQHAGINDNDQNGSAANHDDSPTFGAHAWAPDYTWLPPYYALAFIQKSR
jgi:hypothetical protein